MLVLPRRSTPSHITPSEIPELLHNRFVMQIQPLQFMLIVWFMIQYINHLFFINKISSIGWPAFNLSSSLVFWSCIWCQSFVKPFFRMLMGFILEKLMFWFVVAKLRSWNSNYIMKFPILVLPWHCPTQGMGYDGQKYLWVMGYGYKIPVN